MTSAINPVSTTLYRMHYLVRVPLHLLYLFANCTNHSANLVSLDFTTFYDKVICLAPARRRKPSVDHAKLALKLNSVFFKPPLQILRKALRQWDRLSLDFKGPVRGALPYLLVAVDEYSVFLLFFHVRI